MNLALLWIHTLLLLVFILRFFIPVPIAFISFVVVLHWHMLHVRWAFLAMYLLRALRCGRCAHQLVLGTLRSRGNVLRMRRGWGQAQRLCVGVAELRGCFGRRDNGQLSELTLKEVSNDNVRIQWSVEGSSPQDVSGYPNAVHKAMHRTALEPDGYTVPAAITKRRWHFHRIHCLRGPLCVITTR